MLRPPENISETVLNARTTASLLLTKPGGFLRARKRLQGLHAMQLDGKLSPWFCMVYVMKRQWQTPETLTT